MIINVREKEIHIDDELAAKYEKCFLEPVDEEIILIYVSMFTKCGGDDTEMDRHTTAEIEDWVRQMLQNETEGYNV
jgi:hypothetical protein